MSRYGEALEGLLDYCGVNNTRDVKPEQAKEYYEMLEEKENG